MPLFKRYFRAATFLGVCWLLSPAHVVAQPSESGALRAEERELTAAGVPLAEAVEVGDGPLIDGDVLNDPAYADARLATGFVQSRPFEGQPASERTEVRIVYTADTLYFGIVCYTEDPTSVIAADSRRDSDMTETDSFQIILDTYLDGQNGFVFGTNPAGVEYDGQVTNEGQGTGRLGGGGGGRPSNNRQQRGFRWRLQPQLGWRVASGHECDRHWVDCRDRDSVSHASVSEDRGAVVGDELPTQHPGSQ